MAERGRRQKAFGHTCSLPLARKGKTIDFLLTAKRDKAAAMGFLTKPCSLSLKAN
jgi:hypothetical protein